MKLKTYVDALNEVLKQNPEYGELDTVYCDEEGNDFKHLDFLPTLGNFNSGDFTQVDNYEDVDEEARITNAVCIN